MLGMDSFLVFEYADGKFPMYRIRNGGVAFVVFKTEERAVEVRRVKNGDDWVIVGKTIGEMYEWAMNARSQGVTHVIPEQENMGDLSNVHVLPIASFLLSLDLHQQ